MDETHKRILNELDALARDGHLGAAAQQMRSRMRSLAPGATSIDVTVAVFLKQNESLDPETRAFRTSMAKELLDLYADSEDARTGSGANFLQSYLIDHPASAQSALLPRWNSLARACHALHTAGPLGNPNLLWEQFRGVFVAYNEFLDGLFPFALEMLRTVAGDQGQADDFSSSYAGRCEAISQLTSRAKRPASVLVAIARPAVRNAAAHGRLWLDAAAGTVKFADGGKRKAQGSMSLVEFAALVHLGSHVGPTYLAAIGAANLARVGDRRHFDVLRSQ